MQKKFDTKLNHVILMNQSLFVEGTGKRSSQKTWTLREASVEVSDAACDMSDATSSTLSAETSLTAEDASKKARLARYRSTFQAIDEPAAAASHSGT